MVRICLQKALAGKYLNSATYWQKDFGNSLKLSKRQFVSSLFLPPFKEMGQMI